MDPSQKGPSARPIKGGGRAPAALTFVAAMALAPYLETIVSELTSEPTALAVIAKGLGHHAVLQRLVERHHRPEELVFVLNANPAEERQLLLGLAKASSGSNSPPPAVLNNDTQAAERMELYLAGGVLLVTSRVLIVDLLCERVPIEQASGVIVCNAHKVSDGSNIAFILRILRQRNRTAFVRALSDDAYGFTRGFAKVEKVMRLLHVKRLQLWPRFHLSVSNVLDENQPIVEELTVPLSSRGMRLQHALLEAVDECLKEVCAEAAAAQQEHHAASPSTLKTSLLLSVSACAAPRHQPERRRLSAHRRERALQELRHHRAHAAPADLAPHVEADARVVRGKSGPSSNLLHSPPSTLHSPPPPLSTLHPPPSTHRIWSLYASCSTFSSPTIASRTHQQPCTATAAQQQHSSSTATPPRSLTPSPPSCCTHHRYYEYLETILDAASLLHPSERPHWLLNCSEAVKTLARDRVFELIREQKVLTTTAAAAAAVAEQDDGAEVVEVVVEASGSVWEAVLRPS